MEQLNDVCTLGQNLARSKNKEPYTECPSFWWFWHHFVFNRALNRLKMAAEDASRWYKGKIGEMNCDPKNTVDTLRRKPRLNDQVYFSSVLTLLLFSWFSFHTFTYFSGRVIQKINVRTSLVVLLLRLHASDAVSKGSAPGQESSIRHVVQPNTIIFFFWKKANLKTSKWIKSGSLTASLMPY